MGNLLLVGNYAPGTGYAWWLMERYWIELAHLMSDHGAATYLAYPERAPLPAAIRACPKIEVVWQPIRTRGLTSLRATTRLLRSLGIGNVYLTARPYFDPGYLAFRAAGVRRIICHDHTPGDRPRLGGLQGGLKRGRNRLPGMHADRWIALSPLMRERAIQSGCIPPDRIAVVPNGIEPIGRDAEAARRVRSLFGLPPEHLIVVTVGRAHPYKRIDFVLEVARRYRDEASTRPVTFLFIGDGPDRPRLEKMAADLGLSGSEFLFAGHRDDVRSILPGCDLAIHPSQGEGFSLAMLEYLSAGLPVIASDIPSVAQVLRLGETGVTYRDGDVAQATEKVRSLAENEVERERMAHAASRFVLREHTLGYACSVLRSTMEACLYFAGGSRTYSRAARSP